MVDEAHDDIKEEPVQAVLPRSERPTPLNKTCIKISTKKKQKHPFSDWTLSREVCCLPSAQIRDVTTRLKSLVQPSDHCLFLLFHMGTNGITTKSLRLIKRDFRALRRMLTNSGAQIVFSSVLLAAGRDFGRNRQAQNMSTWLQDWCLHQNMAEPSRHKVCWGLTGSSCPNWEKCVFGCKLAGPIERDLN